MSGPPKTAQIRALASSLGLDKALTLFEADVMAAAQQAAKLRERLEMEKQLTPSDEPWPPMQVSGG